LRHFSSHADDAGQTPLKNRPAAETQNSSEVAHFKQNHISIPTNQRAVQLVSERVGVTTHELPWEYQAGSFVTDIIRTMFEGEQ
jgi:hypothetical protein